MFKVMIVDDERHIRNGIISLIDWSEMKCEIVNACANGQEAVEYLKSNEADIVVSDIKMPGMDGLELAEYIKVNKPKVKVILLTAYADFTNAQLAIKHNVSEYVVKTEFIDELPSAIKNVQKTIEKERLVESNIEELTMIINENKEDLRNKFLIDLAQNIVIDMETIKRRIDEFDLNDKQYYVVTYEIKYINKLIYDSNDEYCKTINVVSNFISMVFKEYEYSMITIDKNIGAIIVYLNNKKIETSDIVVLCKGIQNMVNQFTNFNVKFAISERCTGIENLPKGYKQSLLALSKVYSNYSNISVYSPKDENAKISKTFDDNSKLQNIQELVIRGNAHEIKKELIDLFDCFMVSNLSLEQAKTKMIVLFSRCLRIYDNYNIEQQDLNMKETIFYKEINESKSLQSLFEVSCSIMKYVLDISKNNDSSKNILVREANKYIRNNYSKNIGLNTIASYLHVNSSYLSRLYKKETGDTLIEALNRHRIDVAKILLRQPSSKVFEVGGEVGIEDPAYFTHVFTKYCGCSPKEYKSKSL